MCVCGFDAANAREFNDAESEIVADATAMEGVFNVKVRDAMIILEAKGLLGGTQDKRHKS